MSIEPDAGALEATSMLEMYRRMLAIREFDEAATRLLRLGKMPGVLHNTTGQEAAVVGASMALRDGDLIINTHRCHGYPIARGGNVNALMAEVLGKADGVCGGRAGELHLIDPEVGVIFGSAILGSGIPVAVGTAFTSQTKQTGQVTLAPFGDGASNEGAIHESMNLASIWDLPVVFLCENNGYAVTVPASYAVSVANIADRAAGYGMRGEIVDGADPVAVRTVVGAAAERARGGGGPSLVEVKTYRTVDHAENLPSQPYRSEEEVEKWRANDPIQTFRRRLLDQGLASEEELEELAAGVSDELRRAVEYAEASPDPDPATRWEGLYADARLNRPPVFPEAH